MAYFSSIHKKVKDFFDTKNYDLQRTFKVNVRGDKSEWSLENKLTDNGKIESELKATNEFERDSIAFTASNKEQQQGKKEIPKLEWKTKRFNNYFDLTTTVKPETIEIDHKRSQGKFNLQAITKYNWHEGKCFLTFSPTYVGIENLTVGAKFNLIRDEKNNYTQEYDLGFQYDVNRNQLWSLVTEESMKKVKVGGSLKFDNTSTFAEFIYDLTPPSANTNTENKPPSSYSVGVNHTLSDVSSVSVICRQDFSTALLYNLEFPKNKVNAQVGLNIQSTNKIPSKYALGWKLILSP